MALPRITYILTTFTQLNWIATFHMKRTCTRCKDGQTDAVFEETNMGKSNQIPTTSMYFKIYMLNIKNKQLICQQHKRRSAHNCYLLLVFLKNFINMTAINKQIKFYKLFLISFYLYFVCSHFINLMHSKYLNDCKFLSNWILVVS